MNIAQDRPSLLSRERCLTLSPTLAVLIGDRQALLLQQLQYWLEINEKSNNQSNYRDGRWWTYNTYEAWIEQNFPFWSVRTLRRLMADLEERGLVLSQKFESSDWKQRKWYTIDYDAVDALETPETVEKSDVVKMATSSGSDWPDHLYTEITPEITPFRSGFSPKNPETGKGINSLEEETPKPAKPKPLFNGTQLLHRSERGWIQLPTALGTVAGHRERIGLINTQAIVWVKDALVREYSDILGVHKPSDDTINGPMFSTMSYNEFLNADGPMSLNQMRAALAGRVSGFQGIFNELVERLFWMSWRKFTED